MSYYRILLLSTAFSFLLFFGFGSAYSIESISNTPLFYLDFDQTVDDFIGNLVPTGTISGYIDNGTSGYAAHFVRSAGHGLSYDVSSIEDKFTLATGFTVAARVWYNSLPGGSFYAAVGGRYTLQPSKRQFVIASHATNCLTNGLCLFAPLPLQNSPVYDFGFISPIVLNTWYNLIYTVDSTGQRLYLSGQLVSTSSNTVNEPTGVPLEIGMFNNEPTIRGLDGYIDHFSVREGVVQGDDISNLNALLSSLQLILGCTDSLAQNYDSSANQDDGSCTYSGTIVSPIFRVDFDQTVDDSIGNLVPTGTISGYIDNGTSGYAAHFVRSAGHGLSYDVSSIEDKFTLATGFTVAARVWYNSLPGGSFYAAVGGRYTLQPSKRQFVIASHATNCLTNGLCLSAPVFGIDTPIQHYGFISPIVLNTWYNLIYTVDSTGQRLYLSGQLVSTSSNTVNEPTGVPLEIGMFNNEPTIRGLDGYIDHFSVREGVVSPGFMDEFLVSLGWALSSGQDVSVPVDLENQFFENTDGLSIEYDIYYNTNSQGPIVIMADSWGSSKNNYRTDVKYMRDNYGFIGVTINTRGKGNSAGYSDAIGYECKDIYELVNYIKNNYNEYFDSSQGVHIMGYSAGGGKALLCSGKYPDFFTSIFATASVANLTRWYETINVSAYPNDRPTIRLRVGNSVNPGNVFYHPSGFPSEGGSIENQEAYDARNASTIGAYNTLGAVYLTHNTGDPRVSLQLSQDYDTNWIAYSKDNDYSFETCTSSVHSRCNEMAGRAWISERTGAISTPYSGDFIVGGWVETALFKVEFLEDVGYMGHVYYDILDDGSFSFSLETVSYTGATQLVVKNVASDMIIYDNGSAIAEISNDSITGDVDYDFDYTDGILSLTINNTLSTHNLSSSVVVPTISEDSLILHMNFDSIVDLTDNQTVSLLATDYTFSGGLCGNGNSCYNIGNFDNGVNLGSPLLTDNSDWTIAFSGYIPSGSSSHVPFVSQYTAGHTGRFYLGKNNNNNVGFRIGANLYFSSDSFSDRDIWQTWVLSRSGFNYILTIDDFEYLNVSTSESIEDIETLLGIYDTAVSVGYIDDVFLFDAAYDYDMVINFIDNYNANIESFINISSLQDHKIFQRNDEDIASILITGDVSGIDELADIEIVYDDVVHLLTGISNEFSHSVILPVGMYDVVVRLANDHDVYDSVSIGVGDIYLLVGQSNQDGRANTKNQSVASSGIYGTMFQQANRCSYYITSNPVVGQWKVNNDPTGNGNASGCHDYGSQRPLVANDLIASYEVPIAWISTTYGGTSISLRQKGQVHYDRALDLVQQATDGQNIIKGILWHQGESDASQIESWYSTRLESMINSFMEDITFEKMLIGIVSLNGVPYGGALADGPQRAQHKVIADYPNVFLGPESYDISVSVDNLHYKTDSEIFELARRWYLHIAREFYNSDFHYPTILGYYPYDSNTLAIVLNQDIEISNYLFAVGYTGYGFNILNSGSSVSHYQTSFVSGINNLLLLDIFSSINIDNFSLSYGNTNLGYDTYVLRSLNTQLSMTRNYEIPLVDHYTITFDPQGGDVDFVSKDIFYGSVIDELPIPIKTGYVFVAWYDQENGTGNLYSSGVIYNNLHDIVLYAYYILEGNDSSEADQPIKSNYGGGRSLLSIYNVFRPSQHVTYLLQHWKNNGFTKVDMYDRIILIINLYRNILLGDQIFDSDGSYLNFIKDLIQSYLRLR